MKHKKKLRNKKDNLHIHKKDNETGKKSVGREAQSSYTANARNLKKRKRNALRDAKHVRFLQLKEANQDEDRNIKVLEKALGLNKRKRNALKKKKHTINADGEDELSPQRKLHSMFIDDGLDYLLDVTENSNLVDKRITKLGNSQKSTSSSNVSQKKAEKNKKRKVSFEDGVSDIDSDEGCTFSDSSAEETLHKPSVSASVDMIAKKPKVWEDIYGRLRDEHGNVIENKTTKSGCYLPPALRAKSEANKNNELHRHLTGLLNKLTESQMHYVCTQIEQMYMKHSRNEMNEALMSLISERSFTPILVPSQWLMEQAMLIAVLHGNVGSEIGAFFLQSLITKLDELIKSSETYGTGKLCNNVLTFLSHLYNYKVTHSRLIFDILKILVESFQDKDIELIQLLLKNVGFSLRKDDPLKLKEAIQLIQTKAPLFESKEGSRIQFMLETLTAIRNNNMYKIPDYDPKTMEHMRKVLRSLLKPGSSFQELVISYDDLLKAEEHGRWWIVGSAWSKHDATQTHNEAPNTKKQCFSESVFSEKILQLARSQRMNTEIRKTIFCIIMTAEDFMDAFRKLLQLNLKHQQEREIISVILHCSLNEKKFNPYYSYLAGKFCKFSRKYQMSLQCALWDKFKELLHLKPYQRNCLAHFLSSAFIAGDLPISVLKVIHFSEMNKCIVQFLKTVLLGVLLHDSEEACINVFKRIAPAKNLNLLREGLRIYMHHFLLKDTLEPHVAELLPIRIKAAEKALNSAKHLFKL